DIAKSDVLNLLYLWSRQSIFSDPLDARIVDLGADGSAFRRAAKVLAPPDLQGGGPVTLLLRRGKVIGGLSPYTIVFTAEQPRDDVPLLGERKDLEHLPNNFWALIKELVGQIRPRSSEDDPIGRCLLN